MVATLHALMLLAIPVGAIVVCVVARHRHASRLVSFVCLGVALGLGFLCWLFNQHMCFNGSPVAQWLIPMPFLWLVLVCLADTRLRRLTGALIAVGMVGLSCQYTDIVHGERWTGSSQWERPHQAVAGAMLRAIVGELAELPQDDPTPHTAGWLRDLPFAEHVNGLLNKRRLVRGEIEPVWHSRFTVLYRRVYIPQDVWFPGGALADGAEGLELRDRLRGEK